MSTWEIFPLRISGDIYQYYWPHYVPKLLVNPYCAERGANGFKQDRYPFDGFRTFLQHTVRIFTIDADGKVIDLPVAVEESREFNHHRTGEAYFNAICKLPNEVPSQKIRIPGVSSEISVSKYGQVEVWNEAVNVYKERGCCTRYLNGTLDDVTNGKHTHVNMITYYDPTTSSTPWYVAACISGWWNVQFHPLPAGQTARVYSHGQYVLASGYFTYDCINWEPYETTSGYRVKSHPFNFSPSGTSMNFGTCDGSGLSSRSPMYLASQGVCIPLGAYHTEEQAYDVMKANKSVIYDDIVETAKRANFLKYREQTCVGSIAWDSIPDSEKFQHISGYFSSSELEVDVPKPQAAYDSGLNLWSRKTSWESLPQDAINGCAMAYIKAFEDLPNAASMNNLENFLQCIGTLKDILCSGGLAGFTKAQLRRIKTGSDFERFQKLWLAFRYSYNTSRADIKEAQKVLQRIKALADAENIKAYGYYRTDNGTEYRAVITYCVEELKALQSIWERFGLDARPGHLWDIVPFSFVVDWFLDVGGKLEAEYWRQIALKGQPTECWCSITRQGITNQYGCVQTDYIRLPGAPPSEAVGALDNYQFSTPSGQLLIKRGLDALALFGHQ